MKSLLKYWRWYIPLLLWSVDAHAWGLYTHVYFAQLLLWAVPLSDPRYRRAIRSFPRLVLAGACLPDLALLSERPWGEPFSTTHQWQRARKLLDDAQGDEEYALSLGFVSHLLVDVIAHNHFVPAHEKMWGNVPVLTHAACEWAMDMHIRQQLFAEPGELMRTHRDELAEYVAQHFACSRLLAARGVSMLAGAENLLRSSRLAHLCYHGARALDAGMQRRFNYYLSETGARLAHIDRILSGEEPVWDANPHADDPAVRNRIELISPMQLRHRIPLPQDVFSPNA
ncbi:MAG: zinc dependent phospholipase C family protein [Nitrosomonadales bacterium]|nr:zinc dependent phospholipase C family protein [Nitrosomonadales bacterium]